MFEKVSRSLKYDLNFFFVHKHINIYMDTSPDRFTLLALHVQGNYGMYFLLFPSGGFSVWWIQVAVRGVEILVQLEEQQVLADKCCNYGDGALVV